MPPFSAGSLGIAGVIGDETWLVGLVRDVGGTCIALVE
jgi:hypothetical protein